MQVDTLKTGLTKFIFFMSLKQFIFKCYTYNKFTENIKYFKTCISLNFISDF